MNTLQWALLVMAGAVLLALVVLSRRDKQGKAPRVAPNAGEAVTPPRKPRSAEPEAPRPPPRDHAGPDFDDFGVGKPRRTGAAAPPPPKSAPPPAPPVAPPDRPTPAFVKAGAPPREKIVALFVAEHEGTKILGTRIHKALEAQNLRYNAKNKAYDRVDGNSASYSVTSLTAPGHLDPAQAANFSTPGLAFFMKLPGPAKPEAAFRDLIATAHALARDLNAFLFDADHKPLTDEKLRALSAEVETWAREAARG